MYTKQEASKIRQQFWTSFGQYMRPIPSVSGETVNWLNYKTGTKDLFFRMDADNDKAVISIEFKQRNREIADQYFERLKEMMTVFKEELGEDWLWLQNVIDDDDHEMHVIKKELQRVNVLRREDWPQIIEFLKPRIISLDRFWDNAKHAFTN